VSDEKFTFQEENGIMSLRFARTSLLALALAVAPAGLSSMLPGTAEAQTFSAVRQAIAEASSTDESLATFYRAQDFQPIWTSSAAIERRSALIAALEQADIHGLPTDRYDIDALRQAFAEATNPWARGQADVMATRMFLQYANDVHSGFLDPGALIPDIFQDLPRQDPLELLTAFMDANPHAFMATLPPQDPAYARLLRVKLHLEDLAARGRLRSHRTGRQPWHPATRGPAVVALRNRLIAMGYLDRSITAEYDARLQAAVVEFQLDNGINADGVAGRDDPAVNRSVEDHWNDVVLHMERQRWLNDGTVPDRLIFVNLVDFHVRVIDQGETTFITRSVDRRARPPDAGVLRRDGAHGHQPELVCATLDRHAVLHPEHHRGRRHLPAASVERPGREPRRHRHEPVFGVELPLRPAPAAGAAQRARQVKFMFPNRHAIYLHDTPEQYLMDREVRTFSSGCIRLADPHDFAYHLLARQSDDPVNLFHRILNTGQETQLDLEEHIPVHLTYWTAWVDDDGGLNFRDDVYGRNARLGQAIRAMGVVMPDASS
jgi:murein L,D-transpeptidase YcbB/YkuD